MTYVFVAGEMAAGKKVIERQKKRENRAGYCFGFKVNNKIAHDVAYFVRHSNAYMNMVVVASTRTEEQNNEAMYGMVTLSPNSTFSNFKKKDMRLYKNFEKGRGPKISSNDYAYSGCQSQTNLDGQNAYLAFIIIEGGYNEIGSTHPLFVVPSMTFLFLAYK